MSLFEFFSPFEQMSMYPDSCEIIEISFRNEDPIFSVESQTVSFIL